MKTNKRTLPALILSSIVATTLSTQAIAAVVITAPPGISPSTTDAFDISTGITVLGNSTIASPFDVRSAFGFTRPSGIEPDNTYFAEGSPVGTIDFITIKALAPVTISGFNLFTYDDSFPGGSGSARGMTQFRLLSSANGVTFTPIETASFSNSYLAAYGNWNIVASATFAPTTAEYFRIEATRATTFGPRIVEVDAVPEPTSTALIAAAITLIAVRRNRRE